MKSEIEKTLNNPVDTPLAPTEKEIAVQTRQLYYDLYRHILVCELNLSDAILLLTSLNVIYDKFITLYPTKKCYSPSLIHFSELIQADGEKQIESEFKNASHILISETAKNPNWFTLFQNVLLSQSTDITYNKKCVETIIKDMSNHKNAITDLKESINTLHKTALCPINTQNIETVQRNFLLVYGKTNKIIRQYDSSIMDFDTSEHYQSYFESLAYFTCCDSFIEEVRNVNAYISKVLPLSKTQVGYFMKKAYNSFA